MSRRARGTFESFAHCAAVGSLKRCFTIPFLLVGLGVVGYGVFVVATSPAPRWAWVGAILAIAPFVFFILSLADRFDVPMHFCVDAENKIARQLGIEHLGGVAFMMEPLGYGKDTVLPTVLIADPEGILVYADLTDNYRVRPEPSTFLAALDAGA